MEPQIRFCTSADGVRIAYGTLGDGPPLVRVPRWGQAIEVLMLRGEEPEAFYDKLGQERRLIVVERRGQGHSQREVDDVSMAAHVADVRAVTKHLGLDRFTMFGDGDAVAVCIAYAAAHPEQVSRLILWGGYARSGPVRSEEAGLSLADVARLSQLLANMAIASLFFPSGLVERQRRIARLWEQSISLEMGLKYVQFVQDINIVDLLAKIACPALVLHRRGDRTGHTLEMSREIAALIPEARLVIVEGDIGLPEYDHEQVIQVITEFLGEGEEAAAGVEPLAKEDVHTILFTDMEGSTTLTQRLGDAKAQEVLRTHNRIVRDALKAHSGTEIKHTGDGIMASFTSASRALECAIAIQRALAQHNEANPDLPIRIRIGLNAGEPVAEEEDLFGTAVQLAARIAAKAEGEEILVSDTLRGLVAGKGFLFSDRGDVALRGFEDPVRLFEVRWRE
jgi:class 3 adenylate cyclase/pimeloyl-ACP methyl ester carboxylesterase